MGLREMTALSVAVSVLLSLTCCLAAPSHDAVRLGGLSLQQRVPNSCSTTTGSPCVFPFTYGGVEHRQCTYADSPLPWCATATQADGKHIIFLIIMTGCVQAVSSPTAGVTAR